MAEKEPKASKKEKKEDGDDKDAESKMNWGDNVVGAAALSNRRLLRCLTVSDSQEVLVYGDTKRILAADCSTGELIACEQPHSGRVAALGYNQEKKLIVTAGGNDKKVVVWDLPNMKIVAEGVTDKKVVALELDKPCEHVVFAEKSGEVFSKPLSALDTPAKHLLGHISSLTAMVMSEDGTRILSGDRDEKIRISHYPCTYDMLAVCLAHTELISCVETFGDRIISAGADAMLCLWKLDDATLLDSHSLSEASSSDQPIPEPTTREKESWDFKAAGTAQATASVSGRFRGKNEAAPIASMALHRPTKLVAVTVERSNQVTILKVTDDDKFKLLATISLGDSLPLGISFLGALLDAKPVLVVAAPFQEDALLAFSLSLSPDASSLSASPLPLADATAPQLRAVKAVAECAKADFLAHPPAEEDVAAAKEQQQYVQKRRRHTEPGWKDHTGKKN